MRVIVALILFLSLLSGCATTGYHNARGERDVKEPVNDLILAYCSHAAYPDTMVFEEIEDFNFNRSISFDIPGTDTQAYLLIDYIKKIAVVSYRGTDGKKDAKIDIKFLKKKYNGYRVHRGFLKAYLSVKDKIDGAINQLTHDYIIYVTGHSLGGALAAMHGLFAERPVHRIVTFGQPRIGNKRTAKALSMLNYTRYVNGADIVARRPRINYFHGGELAYITTDGDRIYNPSSKFMAKDRLGSFVNRGKDHKSIRYVRKMIVIYN